MSENKRIGILGGTFNPVHHGHIELGLRIKKSFDLDRVLYVLSARPPHKENREVGETSGRWAMLKAALSGHNGLEPSGLEIKRPGPSWTIDTLAELRQTFPGSLFFFITGSDGFLTIKTWKEYRVLLQEVIFIILLRTPGQGQKVKELLAAESIPLETNHQRHHSPPLSFLVNYSSPWLELSSSAIRDKIRKGESVDDLLDNRVKIILEEKKLYESHSDPD